MHSAPRGVLDTGCAGPRGVEACERSASTRDVDWLREGRVPSLLPLGEVGIPKYCTRAIFGFASSQEACVREALARSPAYPVAALLLLPWRGQSDARCVATAVTLTQGMWAQSYVPRWLGIGSAYSLSARGICAKPPDPAPSPGSFPRFVLPAAFFEFSPLIAQEPWCNIRAELE